MKVKPLSKPVNINIREQHTDDLNDFLRKRITMQRYKKKYSKIINQVSNQKKKLFWNPSDSSLREITQIILPVNGLKQQPHLQQQEMVKTEESGKYLAAKFKLKVKNFLAKPLADSLREKNPSFKKNVNGIFISTIRLSENKCLTPTLTLHEPRKKAQVVIVSPGRRVCSSLPSETQKRRELSNESKHSWSKYRKNSICGWEVKDFPQLY